jgi:hypothetical protein
MNKPIGFEKIIDYAGNSLGLWMGSAQLTNVDYIWASPKKQPNNFAILYIFDWGRNHWHIRLAKRGEGMKGIWYDTYLPMSIKDIQTIDNFHELLHESSDRVSDTISNVPTFQSVFDLKCSDVPISDIVNMQLPLVLSQARPYVVQSDSGPSRYYTVYLNTLGEWECSCPAFMYSKSVPKECKHIKKVKKKTNFQPVPNVQSLYHIP